MFYSLSKSRMPEGDQVLDPANIISHSHLCCLKYYKIYILVMLCWTLILCMSDLLSYEIR